MVAALYLAPVMVKPKPDASKRLLEIQAVDNVGHRPAAHSILVGSGLHESQIVRTAQVSCSFSYKEAATEEVPGVKIAWNAILHAAFRTAIGIGEAENTGL